MERDIANILICIDYLGKTIECQNQEIADLRNDLDTAKSNVELLHEKLHQLKKSQEGRCIDAHCNSNECIPQPRSADIIEFKRHASD